MFSVRKHHAWLIISSHRGHVSEVDARVQVGCPNAPMRCGLYCREHSAMAEDAGEDEAYELNTCELQQ